MPPLNIFGVKNFKYFLEVYYYKLQYFRLNKCVYPYPRILSSEEVDECLKIKEDFDTFLRNNIKPEQYDKDGKIDKIFYNDLLKFGLFNAPREFGGLNLLFTQSAILLETLPKYDLSTAVMFGIQQTIGTYSLVDFGSHSLYKQYLPRISKGELSCCFCLTEENAGSDIKSIQTEATFNVNEDVWILNGSKIWITNSDIADLFTVFAKTYDPHTDKDGLSVFLVEKSMNGINVSKPVQTMGLKCAHSCNITFNNVKIPKSNMIGKINDGLHISRSTLSKGRLALSIAMCGVMKKILQITIEHAQQRQQFGKCLIEFEDVRKKIANMFSLIYITETLVYYNCGLLDSFIPDFDMECAALKIFATESAWNVCDDAMQIVGGRSYIVGHPLEKIMRDLRIFKILEGSNEVLRQFIYLKGLAPFDPSINATFQLSNSKKDYFWIRLLILYQLKHSTIDSEKQIFSSHLVQLLIRSFGIAVAEKRISTVMDNKSEKLQRYLLAHFSNTTLFDKNINAKNQLINEIQQTTNILVDTLVENNGYPQFLYPASENVY